MFIFFENGSMFLIYPKLPVGFFWNSLKPPGVILPPLTVVLSFIDSMFGND